METKLEILRNSIVDSMENRDSIKNEDGLGVYRKDNKIYISTSYGDSDLSIDEMEDVDFLEHLRYVIVFELYKESKSKENIKINQAGKK